MNDTIPLHLRVSSDVELPASIVMLTRQDLKIILKEILDLKYNKETDIFEVSSEFLIMAENVGAF